PGGGVTSQGRRQRLVSSLLAMGLCLFSCATLPADEILRFTYSVPGDSKTVTLHADEMTTWVDKGQRMVLLKGKVLIEHGVVQARSDEAVAWIDQEAFKKTGIQRIEFYAEGDVVLENGPENRSADRALITITTRGQVRFLAQNGKINQDAQP